MANKKIKQPYRWAYIITLLNYQENIKPLLVVLVFYTK